MCDTIMLAFWVWAIVCWRRGLERPGWLYVAGGLISLCALTKYFGVSLLPLLLVYTLRAWQQAARGSPDRSARDGVRPSLRHALLALLIPLTVLIAYELLTRWLYQRGLLLDAFSFSVGSREEFRKDGLEPLLGLTFAGGCLVSVLFFLPLAWPRRTVVALIALVMALLTPLPALKVVEERRDDALYVFQAAIFLVGGIAVVALAVADLWRHRDADGWLLFLWTAGTLTFAIRFNWVINARSLLPLAPVVGILLARRLDVLRGPFRERDAWREVWPLIPAAVVALLITEADVQQAIADRQAADVIGASFAQPPDRLWFEGHWGFQYYLKRRGGGEEDLGAAGSNFVAGDYLALPDNNYGVFPEQIADTAAVILTIEQPTFPLVSTMNEERGAGFYSHVHGSLPFVFGPSAPVRYRVLRFVEELGAPGEQPRQD
jgi:hypothetical protein